MKSIRHYWLKCCVLTSLSLSSAALANDDANEVFEPLNEKTNVLIDQITNWAASVSLLCIIIFGTLTMTGKIAKVWGISIVAGCLIILVGSGISKFLLT